MKVKLLPSIRRPHDPTDRRQPRRIAMSITIPEPRGTPATPRQARLRALPRSGQPRAVTPRTRPDAGIQPELDASMSPVPITWGGHDVDAPGFDQDQFERAMTRAFVDDLRLKAVGGETFLVYHPAASRGHRVTRETCSCPAGQHEVPCKHRALVIAHLDIRVPEVARRWAQRRRRRERAIAEAA
jgi:hypothetical protein